MISNPSNSIFGLATAAALVVQVACAGTTGTLTHPLI